MKKVKFFLIVAGLISLSFTSFSVPTDRWVEIDLYWFDRDNMQSSVDEFWDRYYPLVEGVDGWKGVVVNVGWLMSYIVEWQGDMNQPISLPKNMKQWGTFNEQGPLIGTTAQRMALWKERFPQERVYTNITYQPWTYGDLKKLVFLLKKVARQKYRIADFKVGSLIVGWDNIYDGEVLDFAKVHPNLFLGGIYSGSVGTINLEAILKADPRKFASYPNGIQEGTPFTVFFGKQWGSLSKNIGLDAILLRDSFLGSGVYGRKGPYGKTAPADPLKVERWSNASSDLVKQTKIANPECIVMGYSNGASGVADLRINCLDLEAIAKEGYLDAWIDQTWAGAWNEVGQRPYTFWNNQDLGWTYQLAYVLAHAAVLADSKVRHYFLTETFDGWESWDIIHNAPDRLRWGIWAYSHAAVKTPEGLKTPKGTYISWGNQGKTLLTRNDVNFLAKNLNEAMTDASQMKEVYGPTLVYNRDAMEWQSKNAPAQTIKEWIDEQAGSLMKWSVPVLSVTRMEYLPDVKSNLFIFQTPSHLSPKAKETVINLIRSGAPVAIVGSPAGGIDPEIAEIVGISTKDKVVHGVKYIGSLHHGDEDIFEGLQSTFPIYQPFTMNTKSEEFEVIYSVDQSPCLGMNTKGNKRILFWDPPELKINVNDVYTEEGTSLCALLGSPVPWVLTARALNSMAKNSGQPYVEEIEEYHPVFVALWEKNDGSYRVLSGNLEEGISHAADQSRKLVLNYPESWTTGKIHEVDELWKGGKQVTGDRKVNIFLNQDETKLYSISKKN